MTTGNFFTCFLTCKIGKIPASMGLLGGLNKCAQDTSCVPCTSSLYRSNYYTQCWRAWPAGFPVLYCPSFFALSLILLPTPSYPFPRKRTEIFKGRNGDKKVSNRKWEWKMLILLLKDAEVEMVNPKIQPFCLFQVLLVNLCEGTFLMSVSIWLQVPCRPPPTQSL